MSPGPSSSELAQQRDYREEIEDDNSLLSLPLILKSYKTRYTFIAKKKKKEIEGILKSKATCFQLLIWTL